MDFHNVIQVVLQSNTPARLSIRVLATNVMPSISRKAVCCSFITLPSYCRIFYHVLFISLFHFQLVLILFISFTNNPERAVRDFYFLNLDDDRVIDAYLHASEARFINHR